MESNRIKLPLPKASENDEVRIYDILIYKDGKLFRDFSGELSYWGTVDNAQELQNFLAHKYEVPMENIKITLSEDSI